MAILVDDGIATGLTIRAAIKELKLHHHPKKIVVAVPIAPQEVVIELEKSGVEVLSIITDSAFSAVSNYYLHFPQVTDKTVIKTLTSSSPDSNFRPVYMEHKLTRTEGR